MCTWFIYDCCMIGYDGGGRSQGSSVRACCGLWAPAVSIHPFLPPIVRFSPLVKCSPFVRFSTLVKFSTFVRFSPFVRFSTLVKFSPLVRFSPFVRSSTLVKFSTFVRFSPFVRFSLGPWGASIHTLALSNLTLSNLNLAFQVWFEDIFYTTLSI